MSQATGGHTKDQDGLRALLAWYRAAGVDAVVSEMPINWLERGEQGPQRPPAQPPVSAGTVEQSGRKTDVGGTLAASSGPAPAMPPAAPRRLAQPVNPAVDQTAAGARDVANQAQSLAELREALSRFDGCGLKATAKNLCFYRGADVARVMVIGEAPGRDEDRSGMPFVGRAGQLLDKMLGAISLDESSVHITNVVYWRPPGNRTPTPQEVLVCRPFLERQIELVTPDIVLTVGGPATKAILDTTQGIMRMRGKWGTLHSGGREIRVMPSLHPAYLLRTPAAKRLVWRDLLAVRADLDGVAE